MVEKLLVIDDEASIAKIILKIATDLGYEARAVTDPQRAIAVFEDFVPDIVMIDMVMPGLDGIDILRPILAKRPDIRVIVMSGYGPGYLKLAKAVATFERQPDIVELTKPFRRVDVVAMLGRGRTVASAAAPPAFGGNLPSVSRTGGPPWIGA